MIEKDKMEYAFDFLKMDPSEIRGESIFFDSELEYFGLKSYNFLIF